MRRRGRTRTRRLREQAAGLFGLGWLLCACGPEDTLEAYDVTLRTFNDCSQVGAGAVQCAEPEVLGEVTVRGRWVFDYRGSDTFALTTDTGRVLPGVFFSNDRGAVSESCLGQGGQCHFARSRTDSTEPETGCLRIQERAIDAFVLDGALSGVMSDVVVNDESCGTSNVRQVLIEVTGEAVLEAVKARGERAP